MRRKQKSRDQLQVTAIFFLRSMSFSGCLVHLSKPGYFENRVWEKFSKVYFFKTKILKTKAGFGYENCVFDISQTQVYFSSKPVIKKEKYFTINICNDTLATIRINDQSYKAHISVRWLTEEPIFTYFIKSIFSYFFKQKHVLLSIVWIRKE